jgi:hypothetical protein
MNESEIREKQLIGYKYICFNFVGRMRFGIRVSCALSLAACLLQLNGSARVFFLVLHRLDLEETQNAQKDRQDKRQDGKVERGAFGHRVATPIVVSLNCKHSH